VRVISWADRFDGRVNRATSYSAGQGAGPIAVGDGAVFFALFHYDGSPYRIRRFDLATQRTGWTVDVPGTHVFGARRRVWCSVPARCGSSRARCRS